MDEVVTWPPDRPSLSVPHRLWRALPQSGRREWLTRITRLAAPRPDRRPLPPAHGVIVGGELSRASGLGEAARLMLHALPATGLRAWPLEAGFGGARDLPAIYGGRPPAGAPLMLVVNSPLLPAALLRLPRGLLRGRMVIGCWAWELPTVPPAWQAGVPFVHEIWVPSRFTAAALEPLAPGRIRVVPHPLALAPPRPSRLGRASFGLPDDAVVVLVSFNLASSFERKNPLGAVAAFRAAFGDRPDRILLIKVGNPHHFPADVARLQAVVAGAPNIRLETRTLSSGNSHALTACADIVLSLHRSEGFGLVPAEAMLLGKPVIATNWSGNTDFMTDGTAALVGYRLIPARDPRGVFEAPGAVWAEPDLDEAVAHLVRLAENAGLRAALGKRARAGAEACLGVVKLAEALSAIGLPARGSAQFRPPPPAKAAVNVLVWQWGRRGAGPRFAVELAEGLRAIPGVVATLSLSAQAEIRQGAAAMPWEMPFSTYDTAARAVRRVVAAPFLVARLVRALRTRRPDYAICAMPAALDPLMAWALRLTGVPFAVIVHDADLHPGDGFPLQMMIQRLVAGRADALIALTAHVGKRLRQQGLVPRRRLVMTTHPPFSFGPPPPPPLAHGGPLRLLLFGRLRAYKGLDLLAEALTRLGQRADLEVRIAGSGPESEALDLLRALPGVTVENRWVPEAEVGALIAWADALVLSHREASQSGVAAAAIAAGRWLVATRVGGIAEQLGRENLAQLCEPDAASLAEALRALVEFPPPRPAATDAKQAWRDAAQALIEELEISPRH